MFGNEQKITMEELRNLDWQQVNVDFWESCTNYDFFISDIDNDGLSDDVALLKRAVLNTTEVVNGKTIERINPVSPILYGALRTILTTRKKDTVREKLKVYFAGIKDPNMLPDCSAYRVHKWHLVEDTTLSEEVKYSYFETQNYLIVIRHKWIETENENNACIVFIYEKPAEIEEKTE